MLQPNSRGPSRSRAEGRPSVRALVMGPTIPTADSAMESQTFRRWCNRPVLRLGAKCSGFSDRPLLLSGLGKEQGAADGPLLLGCIGTVQVRRTGKEQGPS